MNKTSTIGDLFDMEKQVMDFYDALLRSVHTVSEGENLNLRGAAYEIVMNYRTLQVNLAVAIANNRGIPFKKIPALSPDTVLKPSEATMLMAMKGLFSTHVEGIERLVAEARAGVAHDSLAEMLKSIGLTLLPKEGNKNGE